MTLQRSLQNAHIMGHTSIVRTMSKRLDLYNQLLLMRMIRFQNINKEGWLVMRSVVVPGVCRI